MGGWRHRKRDGVGEGLVLDVLRYKGGARLHVVLVAHNTRCQYCAALYKGGAGTGGGYQLVVLQLRRAQRGADELG